MALYSIEENYLILYSIRLVVFVSDSNRGNYKLIKYNFWVTLVTREAITANTTPLVYRTPHRIVF